MAIALTYHFILVILNSISLHSPPSHPLFSLHPFPHGDLPNHLPSLPQYIETINNLKHIDIKGVGIASFEFDLELKDPASRIFLYKVRHLEVDLWFSFHMRERYHHSSFSFYLNFTQQPCHSTLYSILMDDNCLKGKTDIAQLEQNVSPSFLYGSSISFKFLPITQSSRHIITFSMVPE